MAALISLEEPGDRWQDPQPQGIDGDGPVQCEIADAPCPGIALGFVELVVAWLRRGDKRSYQLRQSGRGTLALVFNQVAITEQPSAFVQQLLPTSCSHVCAVLDGQVRFWLQNVATLKNGQNVLCSRLTPSQLL